MDNQWSVVLMVCCFSQKSFSKASPTQDALPWQYDLATAHQLPVGKRLLRVCDIAFTQRQAGENGRCSSPKCPF